MEPIFGHTHTHEIITAEPHHHEGHSATKHTHHSRHTSDGHDELFSESIDSVDGVTGSTTCPESTFDFSSFEDEQTALRARKTCLDLIPRQPPDVFLVFTHEVYLGTALSSLDPPNSSMI